MIDLALLRRELVERAVAGGGSGFRAKLQPRPRIPRLQPPASCSGRPGSPRPRQRPSGATSWRGGGLLVSQLGGGSQ